MSGERPVIRFGDYTSHGGRVIEGTPRCIVDGIPVARVGDKCTCPIQGHGSCTIIEGDPNYTIDGIPIAFDGCKTSCGASLIASQTKRFKVGPLGMTLSTSNAGEKSANIVNHKEEESSEILLNITENKKPLCIYDGMLEEAICKLKQIFEKDIYSEGSDYELSSTFITSI